LLRKAAANIKTFVEFMQALIKKKSNNFYTAPEHPEYGTARTVRSRQSTSQQIALNRKKQTVEIS